MTLTARQAGPGCARHGGAAAKAATLIEALPWLDRFHGRTVVIKYGGHAMTDDAAARRLRRRTSSSCGTPGCARSSCTAAARRSPRTSTGSASRPLHGGPAGHHAETMDVVRMVLDGQVNRDVVGLINRHGPFAVGMSGEDAHLFTAEPQAGRRRRRAGRHRPGRRDRRRPTPARCAPARRRPHPGRLQRRARRGRRGLQRQRRHRRGRAGRRAGRRQADGPHRRRGPVRGLAATRDERDQRLSAGRAGGACCPACRRHGAQDGGLPARGTRRRARRPTCSTAGVPHACCWRSSPTPASAPWSSPTAPATRTGGETATVSATEDLQRAVRGRPDAQLRRRRRSALGARRGLPGLGRRRQRVPRPDRRHRGQLARATPTRPWSRPSPARSARSRTPRTCSCTSPASHSPSGCSACSAPAGAGAGVLLPTPAPRPTRPPSSWSAAATGGPDGAVRRRGRGGFHGRTMGALALTGKAAIREPFGPVRRRRAVRAVRRRGRAARRGRRADCAAVFLEPRQGEGGVVPPPAGYLRAARRSATPPARCWCSTRSRAASAAPAPGSRTRPRASART